MKLQITMTGEPGCGKTTIAKLVNERLGSQYLSTGAIQRELAESMGLTTLELNKLSETDPSIDEKIDAHTRSLAGSRKLVVDSRVAWRFLPNSLKVFLVCPPSVAARRVHAQNRKDESYADSQQAVELLRQRFESEKARFARYYGASLGNLRNYDLVIDTSLATPSEIADKVCDMALADQTFKGMPRLFLCPQNLLPTKHVRGFTPQELNHLQDHFGEDHVKRGETEPVEVSRIGGQWAILNGHKRVALALHLKVHLIPGRLLGQDDEILDYGVTARSMFEREVVPEQVQQWEKAFEFKFT